MKNKKIAYYIISIFIMLFGVLYLRQTYLLNKCQHFTVAKPISIGAVGGVVKGGRSMDYIYYDNLNKYQTNEFLDELVKAKTDEELLNKRYFVRYSCDNAEVSKLIWNVSVPDTLIYIPANGWDKIPYGLDNLK